MEPDAVLTAILELRAFTEFSLGDLIDRMDKGFAAGDVRFDRLEVRQSRLETRIESLETRLGSLETTVRDGFALVDTRLTAVERSRRRK
jgi:hypothetical protein